MRQTLLAATALLLALPAWAQQGPGYNAQSMPKDAGPMGGMQRGAPSTPAEIRDHARQQGGAGGTAGEGSGTDFSPSTMATAAQRAERQVEVRTVQNLLRQAEGALSRGNWALANEFVERAETTLLNRHATPGLGSREAGRQEGQALRAVAGARAAVAGRDRQGARQALRSAETTLAQIGPGDAGGADATGGEAGMMRGMGGQGMGRPGSAGGGPMVEPPPAPPRR